MSASTMSKFYGQSLQRRDNHATHTRSCRHLASSTGRGNSSVDAPGRLCAAKIGPREPDSFM